MAGRAVFLPPSQRAAYARLPLNRIRSSVIVQADVAAIEKFIADNEASKAKVAAGMQILIRTLAMIVKGYAQQRSAGPVSPTRRSVPALAYRIPVQRITGAYFAGWRVKADGLMAYLVYNDAKEAYLIETGLYQRVRRPILKMSVISMVKFLHGTEIAKKLMPSLTGFGGTPGFATATMETIIGTSTRDMLGNLRAAPVTQIAGDVLAGPQGDLPG